jgi:DNA gyrase subunit B/topoisomerase-4 subunit B
MTSGQGLPAQPPLYRIDIGKDTFWALDDAHKEVILKQHAKNGSARSTPEITRFKGLGEMMPKVLWETTLNPRTRRLLRVDVQRIVTDRVINELMGKDASAGSASSWNGRTKPRNWTSDGHHRFRRRLSSTPAPRARSARRSSARCCCSSTRTAASRSSWRGPPAG